jgi:hypothetical protein
MYQMCCKECGLMFETNRKTREYCSRTCSNTVIARNREDAKESTKIDTVWSCGGGVQSTCIAVLIEQGKLPKPDYSIIVDTGYEKTATMEYVRNVTIPRLADVGVTLNIVKTTDYFDNELFDRQGHLVIPAFKHTRERDIKFDTHCNGKWKLQVTKRWLKEQGVLRAEGWIGISVDEAKRQHFAPTKWYTNRYPLVELKIDRRDCLDIIDHFGWPEPPRTSCYMCPLQDDTEWQKMKNRYPDDFERACNVDDYIKTKDADVYLHKSFKPLREVVFVAKAERNKEKWWEQG